MKEDEQLIIRSYHIHEVTYGATNKVSEDGKMTVKLDTEVIQHPLIHAISLRVIAPDEHQQYTNTIMDVIPLSVKALGRIGQGITNTLTGVYVLLTGVDTNGRQVCNGGGSDGILADTISWGKPGTPLESDYLIAFDVVLQADAWVSRAGPDAAHQACDEFCDIFREQLRYFNPSAYSEKHVFPGHQRSDAKQVVLVKEVSGQGAVYDTRLFANEPGAFAGGKSIIDMGCMPVVLTPNEYRDGIVRALD